MPPTLLQITITINSYSHNLVIYLCLQRQLVRILTMLNLLDTISTIDVIAIFVIVNLSNMFHAEFIHIFIA
jgi:hypothetical protein